MVNKKTQLKSGKRAVKRVARRTIIKKQRKLSFWARVWNGICSVFRWIWNIICKCAKWIWGCLCAFWRWLTSINLIALLNLTLLITIIVLFVMLIIDIVNCKPTFVTPKTIAVNPEVVETRSVKQRPTMPIKRDTATNKMEAVVNVVEPKPDPVAVRQIAKHENKLMGDVIIDSRGAGVVLTDNTVIKGNLYLQEMHKFTLPCNVVVYGNVFLRNLGMLQFCGDFVIKGNIYVSPTSSFGPIPRTAKLYGNIIL